LRGRDLGRGAACYYRDMGLRNRLSQLGISASSIVAILIAACAGGSSSGGISANMVEPVYPYDSAAITVTGTENFYADILHQLGGPKLRIYSFLSDPNADPHQYESNASGARAVADSKLVIENGLGYDSFMDKLLKASPRSDRVVINVQELVGARDGDNVHLWYDPTVMPRVSKAASDALAKLDTENASTYAANLRTVSASLAPINEEAASLEQRFGGAPIAFTEPVFGYMAEAIGLTVKSPQEFMKAVEEGNDPPSQAVAQEQDLITKHQVRVLMYNSQVVTKVTSNIKNLATRNGVPVVGVAETAPPGRSFQDWQLGTLKELEGALAR
jgi:zinc/manganese transport system substrate-binding protein